MSDWHCLSLKPGRQGTSNLQGETLAAALYGLST